PAANSITTQNSTGFRVIQHKVLTVVSRTRIVVFQVGHSNPVTYVASVTEVAIIVYTIYIPQRMLSKVCGAENTNSSTNTSYQIKLSIVIGIRTRIVLPSLFAIGC